MNWYKTASALPGKLGPEQVTSMGLKALLDVQGNFQDTSSGSDVIANLFDDDVDQYDALSDLGISEETLANMRGPEFGNAIKEARDEVVRLSQQALQGMPEWITVHRGGAPKGPIVPVTLSTSTANFFATRKGVNPDTYVVNKSNIVAVVDLFQRGYDESELLVRGDGLRPAQENTNELV